MLTNSADMVGLFEYSNHVTGEIFTALMVLSFWIILIFALKRFEMSKALLSSSFVMFFVSLLLTYAGLLNFLFPIAFLSVCGIVALVLYTNTG